MKELITKLRKSTGVSQEELAQALGISRPTLVAIEKGKADITLTQLKKLAEFFDIPVEIIMDEEMKDSQKVEMQEHSKKSFQRFLNLILECIKHGADDDGKITKTKLAKLVYLCDFASYYKFLKPISGFEYKRLQLGPVPIEFFDIIDTSEAIGVEKSDKAMMISLAEQPDDSVFSKEELELIKEICKKWKPAKTQEIVDFTHKQTPWAICREREVIPYELINNEAPEDVY